MNDIIKAIQYKTKEGENILFISGFGVKRAYRMSRELTEEELKELIENIPDEILDTYKNKENLRKENEIAYE